MRVAVGMIVAFGCGGAKPAPAKPPVKAAPPDAPVATQAPAELICDRVFALKQQGCGSFASVDMTRDTCVRSFRTAPEPGSEVEKMIGCMLEHDTCEPVQSCLAALVDTSNTRACDVPTTGQPAGIPAAEWATRNGANVTKFSQAKSTPALPIEMCGIDAENAWLASLACDDGSHPITTETDAEHARAGNVGIGGRCGSIIDHYEVRCPGNRTYVIYIDAYICPLK